MGSGHRLLSRRVHDLFSIVRVINPPQDSKKDCPDGAEKVIGHKNMGKIERALGVFLFEAECQ